MNRRKFFSFLGVAAAAPQAPTPTNSKDMAMCKEILAQKTKLTGGCFPGAMTPEELGAVLSRCMKKAIKDHPPKS